MSAKRKRGSRPKAATVRRRLSELRSAVIDGPDPVASRIAYAMECAVRWAVEPTAGWPSLANTARSAAQILRNDLRKKFPMTTTSPGKTQYCPRCEADARGAGREMPHTCGLADHQPPPTPAVRLAAVLRSLGLSVGTPDEDGDFIVSMRPGDRWYPDPTSKDDLARVVGMLTAEQRRGFDLAMLEIDSPYDDGTIPVDRMKPSSAIIAPPEKILAALEAAVK